ncbi:MAG: hypothetical protein WC850_00525 [Candidatus Gracilibacteria bacterium]
MEKNIKKLLENINQKDIVKILEHNISNIKKNDEKNRVIIYVNKKYVMNDLLKSDKLEDLIKGIHTTFGDNYSTSLKLKADISHDREMLVPRTIHF